MNERDWAESFAEHLDGLLAGQPPSIPDDAPLEYRLVLAKSRQLLDSRFALPEEDQCTLRRRLLAGAPNKIQSQLKRRRLRERFSSGAIALGWVALAVFFIALLAWSIKNLIPELAPSGPASPPETQVLQVGSYASASFEQMLEQSEAVFAGKVTAVSPARWNQDSGEYWEGGLQFHTVELEVLAVIVDEVGLEEKAVITVMGPSPSDGLADHDLKAGQRVVIFARRTDISWQDGSRQVLYLMGVPSDSYLLLDEQGRLYRPREYPTPFKFTLEQLGREIAARRSNLSRITPTPLGAGPDLVLTPIPLAEQQLAFITGRDGYAEIYLMNADGTGQTNLTQTQAEELAYPAWSPDGLRIAFAAANEGHVGQVSIPDVVDLFIMNSDGSGVKQLTESQGEAFGPVWAPVGARIAFVSLRDEVWDIYSVNAGGSGLRNLTAHSGADMNPAWSPDGKRIAFNSSRDGNLEIYVMNADGSGLANLTNHPGDDGAPRWSPDGKWIAFTSDRDGAMDFFVMAVSDTSGAAAPVQLTFKDHAEGIAWSPDGTRLAFVSNRDGNAEIYVMNPDGSGQTNLTRNAAVDLEPAWSPDGQWIAFMSRRAGGEAQIYVMRPDGSALARLTDLPGGSGNPVWRPESESLTAASTPEPLPIRNEDDESVLLPAPHGQWTAILGREAGSLELEDSQGVKHTLFPEGSAVKGAQWSSDGKRLAVTLNNLPKDWQYGDEAKFPPEIHVVDFDGGAFTLAGSFYRADSQAAGARIILGAWSPDNLRILFWLGSLSESHRADGFSLWVLDLNSLQAARLAEATLVNPAYQSWAPDGSALAFTNGGYRSAQVNKWLSLYDAAPGQVTTIVPEDELVPGQVAWSPAGESIAFAAVEASQTGDEWADWMGWDNPAILGRRIYLLDPQDREYHRLNAAESYQDAPRWSADGKALYYVQIDGDQAVHMVADPASGEAQPMLGCQVPRPSGAGYYGQADWTDLVENCPEALRSIVPVLPSPTTPGLADNIEQIEAVNAIRILFGLPGLPLEFVGLERMINSPSGDLAVALYQDTEGRRYSVEPESHQVVEIDARTALSSISPDALPLSQDELRAKAEKLIRGAIPDFDSLQAGLSYEEGVKGDHFFFTWSAALSPGSMNGPFAQIGLHRSGELIAYYNTLALIEQAVGRSPGRSLQAIRTGTPTSTSPIW